MATSLRTRVFLLLAAILALLAAFVMIVSQRAVTDTVYQSEARNAANVLDLVTADVRERYRQLLREKIATVRGQRARLQAHGELIDTTLNTLARMADDDRLDPSRARALALDWVRSLEGIDGMTILVYDRNLQLLAGPPGAGALHLADLRDVKGEAFAASVFAHPAAERYAVYAAPGTDALQAGASSTQFGYFRHLASWDWAVAVTLPAGTVQATLAAKQAEIVAAVRATADRLTLAQRGFIFVFDDAGQILAAPAALSQALLGSPADAAGLLGRIEAATDAAPLAQLSHAAPNAPDMVWEIAATRVKPLGWYVASAVPRSDLLAPARTLLRQQGAVFLAALAIALALAWVFATRLVRPLNLLTAYARALPEAELTTPRPVPPEIAALPARHRDEVGRLAGTLLAMEDTLYRNVQRLMRQTSERERMESELSIARDIQLGLLPIALDADVSRQADLCASMTAAKEVGGDLYDYFLLADGRLCIVIGDVSGKGVPAALFMAITRTVIRSAANQEAEIGPLLQAINDRLSDHNPNLMFVTLFLGLLDLRDGTLDYANAGHPPPWLIVDGEVGLLAGRSGPACGIEPGWPYTAFSTRLPTGAMLLGYTDGITDAESPAGEHFGDERPARLLASLTGAPTSAQAVAALLEGVARFAAGAEQADDITLIALRHLAPPEESP